LNLRIIKENVFKVLMILSLIIVLGSLIIIVALVVINGFPSLSIEMLTQTSTGGYYLGQGGGGILNAILGSLFLALPATLIADLIGLAISDFIHPLISGFIRFSLDVLWGIPSIIYGVFCFMFMIMLGMRASLIVGIIALTLLEIPIITRYIDEAIGMVPRGLKESAYSLGSTKFETAYIVVRRQAFPGILAGVLLGLGRGIGDAASILFTSGFSSDIPTSIFDSTAALPTMIFRLYTSPIPVVRQRAYAAAFILLIIVLTISVVSRLLTRRFKKHVIK
jgi:phosphate transport system permease protein